MSVVARIRERPIELALEWGSVFTCVGLFVGSLVLLASGPPQGTGTAWLVLIGAGAVFVLFWTAIYPLYARVRY